MEDIGIFNLDIAIQAWNQRGTEMTNTKTKKTPDTGSLCQQGV